MKTFIALLRGINVGGHRKIKMADVKRLHETMGHKNIVTYLQTGNVIFDCTSNDSQTLARNLEQAYDKEFRFFPDVIIRSTKDFADAADKCPFPLTAGRQAKFLHLISLSAVPDSAAIGKLSAHDGPEEKQVIEDNLYVYYTDGSGTSKLNLGFIERTLKVKGTARNWNTVSKLLELTEQR